MSLKTIDSILTTSQEIKRLVGSGVKSPIQTHHSLRLLADKNSVLSPEMIHYVKYSPYWEDYDNLSRSNITTAVEYSRKLGRKLTEFGEHKL